MYTHITSVNKNLTKKILKNFTKVCPKLNPVHVWLGLIKKDNPVNVYIRMSALPLTRVFEWFLVLGCLEIIIC